MLRTLLLPILVALALAGSAASPRADGFAVDVAALGSLPFGTLHGGDRVADMLDPGYGVRAEVLYGVTGHVAAGLGVAGAAHDAHVRVGQQRHDADVTVFPVYALLRLHTTRAVGLGLYAQSGAGIVSWNVRPLGAGVDSRTQTTFLYLAGGGVSYLLSRRWDVRAGAEFQQALTGRGDVWTRGDDPKSLVVSLGAHFQR